MACFNCFCNSCVNFYHSYPAYDDYDDYPAYDDYDDYDDYDSVVFTVGYRSEQEQEELEYSLAAVAPFQHSTDKALRYDRRVQNKKYHKRPAAIQKKYKRQGAAYAELIKALLLLYRRLTCKVP